MSTNNATKAYIASLQYTSTQINLYVPTFIMIFGVVGNLTNILVFTQRALRSKPCVIYFLVSSITSFMSLISGLTPRLFQSLFLVPDATQVVSVLCKLRIVVLFITRTISSWLLAFATVDRYVISSLDVNKRQMSNLKNAYRCIIVITILSIIFWTESIYCFDVNLTGTPQPCYAKSDSCRIFNDLSQSLVTTLIPSTIMFILGLCTIGNIRQSRQVGPSLTNTTGSTRRGHGKDEQSLTVMLASQVILLTIFNLPQAGQKFYLTYTFYAKKASSQVALENFVFNVVLLFTYIPNCIPFYLYTITGSLFRETLVKLVQHGIGHLKCWN
ncbi:unnamed protein product [Rotaria sp. Silwood1]|nr:unnamed protein product [Rotaria sp. Silwood1]CAF1367186.1 unnamed protein product [Rotaria sp. Silwood1]CAF1652571.1 unnamed protein product [Rotaria sp. Silwood1]CAF1652577.1 unnamed protein product [Rotaria sp. Silwood1]CAF3883239.1 unnamed protein product [Rotaria sp. Silwood1]